MVWDVASGRRLTVFRAHSRHSLGGGVLLTVSFKFSPDGKLVLSSDTAGYGYVWTARSGRILNAIRGPAEPPGMWSGWGGAISPDDRLAVTVASWDSAAHVYEVGRPRALLTPRGSQQDIEDAAFSPDSSLLATISGDGVRLWTTQESNPVLTLSGSFGSAITFTALDRGSRATRRPGPPSLFASATTARRECFGDGAATLAPVERFAGFVRKRHRRKLANAVLGLLLVRESSTLRRSRRAVRLGRHRPPLRRLLSAGRTRPRSAVVATASAGRAGARRRAPPAAAGRPTGKRFSAAAVLLLGLRLQ
jgi:hypothetical protein